MSCLIEYQRWLAATKGDLQTQRELVEIASNPQEIEGRFSSMLEFGTAGLRGILGVGLNRMNIYTVRHATQGLANLIVSNGEGAKKRGVAIAHDCRNMSREFALEAAGVLAAAGISSYVFDALRPTPELSFAVREFNCIAGINITASHNPKEYNGYKVYWEGGAQIGPEQADIVIKEIRENDIFSDVFFIPLKKAEERGFVKYIGAEIDEKFLNKVLEQSICRDAVQTVYESFKIIYTPFHGTGYKLVPEVLRRLGFKHILPVPEQMVIDGNFPTVKSPNPEDKEGFALAIELAKRVNSDLIIGTDPDADRMGIIVRDDKGEYVSLTGNQVGVLLADYIITARKEKSRLPADAAIITSIVSTQMTKAVCKDNNVKFFEVLTGFKFVGEKIRELEQTGEATFIFAFEESYGYLAGTYARDKDAVVASMLISEAAAFYKCKGMTLYKALQSLFEKYGFFSEKTINIKMDGYDALERMKKLMEKLRSELPSEIGGVSVVASRDYLKGIRTLHSTGEKTPTGQSKSNVLFYEMADGSSIIVRPSGTEPKVKLYLLVRSESKKQAEELINNYEQSLKSFF
jgi:phosphoglucomutase